MLFSSLTFLFLFLPITFGCYFIAKKRHTRNIILLIFSLIFYSWGEPKLIILMITLLIVNYFGALLMDKQKDKNRLMYMILILIIDLGCLFYFKYFNFFLHNINMLFETSYASFVILPIGISFYLFQIMSYIIDVYRKDVEVQKDFLLLSTYIALFPQLVAGPIVRYSTIQDQLLNRKETWDDFYLGFRRFIVGLVKKVILSNSVAIIANMVFVSTPLKELNFTLAWMGAISYTLQIYFDFSGYSDMAIGLGRMFGFKFLENFNYPYISQSITDFWRRWHISLSSWFRDYIYIPLGGNRKGIPRQIINILIVWMLTGLWHGAAWNFVLWGLYFAFVLIIEKLFLLKLLNKMPKIIRWLYSIILIMIGWVIFNSTSITQVITVLYNMIDISSMMSISAIKHMRIIYLWPYFLLALLASFPIFKVLQIKLENTKYGQYFVDFILLILLYWCLVLLINNSYNPFIYYRF